MASSNSAETEHLRILLEFEMEQAERNAKKMERAVAALERRYDPLARATQRHETAQKTLNRALEAGKITAERHAVAMAKVEKEYEEVQRAAGNATKVLAAHNAAVNASTGFVGRNRAAVQQLGYQVGDFAVQVQGGTSVVTAFTQQGSQMLGVFGPIGAIMGAVLAVALPLGAALYNMASGTDTAAVKAGDLDKAMSDLDAAMESYVRFTRTAATDTSTLYKEFGEFAGQIKGFSEFMKGVSLAETFDVLKTSIAPLKVGLAELEPLFENVEKAKQRLAAVPANDGESVLRAKEVLELLQEDLDQTASKLGLLPEQAQALITALNKIDGAKSIEDIGLAAADALSNFKEIDATGLNIPGPLREAAKALEGMVESAAKAKTEADGIAIATSNIDMSSASSQALALAGDLGVALGVAQQLNATLNANAGISTTKKQKRSGPALGFGGVNSALPAGVGTNEVSYDSGPIARIQNQQVTAATNWTPSKSSGGGGKKSGGGKTTPLLQTAEAELQNLQRQIEMLGKTKAQIAELTVKHNLLDEAKKRGLDLDAAQGKSGMTLRREIDAQAASVGRLAEEYERAKLSQEQFDKAIDDISGAMAGAILKGESFRESIANIFKSIAFDILKSGIKESILSVFSTKATAGSGGGSFLGNVLGGLFGGFRAAGGEVSSGKGYIVGEKGPEWFEPGSSGRVIPNDVLTAPSRSTPAAGGGTSVVQIILDPKLEGTILKQAAGHALEISGATAKVQQRSLPALMASMQARGTIGG